MDKKRASKVAWEQRYSVFWGISLQLAHTQPMRVIEWGEGQTRAAFLARPSQGFKSLRSALFFTHTPVGDGRHSHSQAGGYLYQCDIAMSGLVSCFGTPPSISPSPALVGVALLSFKHMSFSLNR